MGLRFFRFTGKFYFQKACKRCHLTSKPGSSDGFEGLSLIEYAIPKLFWSSALQETLYLRRYRGPPLSGTRVPYQPQRVKPHLNLGAPLGPLYMIKGVGLLFHEKSDFALTLCG